MELMPFLLPDPLLVKAPMGKTDSSAALLSQPPYSSSLARSLSGAGCLTQQSQQNCFICLALPAVWWAKSLPAQHCWLL